MLAYEKVGLIDRVADGRTAQTTRICINKVCDLVHRKRAERKRVRLVLNRHHDRVVTARLTVAVTCIEVVSDFVGRNSHAEWRYCFQIGKSISVRWIETYNSHPCDAAW